MADHNVYAFDQRRGRLRLEAVLEVKEDRRVEHGYIEDHGERLPALLTRFPTFKGCLVEARILGAVRHSPAFTIA